MKRLLLLLGCLSFTMVFANSALADRDRDHENRDRGHEYRDRGREYGDRGREYRDHGREYGDRGREYGNRGHEYRDRGHEYRGHHGYRDVPYDRHRHYDHQNYSGQKYVYRGHWRSWADWDNYRKAYPRMYKRGHYYREGDHLMFRFCDSSGSCFFFSIGR